MSDDNRTASIIFKLAIEDSTLSAGVKAALAELDKFTAASRKSSTDSELKDIETVKVSRKKAKKESSDEEKQAAEELKIKQKLNDLEVAYNRKKLTLEGLHDTLSAIEQIKNKQKANDLEVAYLNNQTKLKTKLDDLKAAEEIRIKNFNNNLQVAETNRQLKAQAKAKDLADAEEIKIKNFNNNLEIAATRKAIKDKERADEKQKSDDAKKNEIQDLTSALQQGTAALGAFYTALKLIATDNAFIKASSEYEVNLRNFNSVALQTEEQLKKTHEALKGMATEEQLAGMTELAKVLKTIQTSGFDGAEGIKVLDAANKAAKANLADLMGTAVAITSVLNSYSLSADHAAGVANINSKAIKLGKLSQDELNASVGTAISLSAEAGVAYEQIAAGLATIHKQGVSASISATELNAVIKAAFHPGAQSLEWANSLGIELSSAAIQAKGLGGFVTDIFDKTKQFGAEQQSVIAKMIPDIRSLRGLEKLANDEGETFNKILAEMKDGTDQTSKALEQQVKTFAYLNNQIHVNAETIKIEMGDVLQSALRPFLMIINDITTAFIKMPDAEKAVIESIILLATGVTSLTIAVVGANIASAFFTKQLFLMAVQAEYTADTIFTVSSSLAVLKTAIFALVLAPAVFEGIHLWAQNSNNEFLKSIDLLGKLETIMETLNSITAGNDAESENSARTSAALQTILRLEAERVKLKKEGKDLSLDELTQLREAYGTAIADADKFHKAEYKAKVEGLKQFIDTKQYESDITQEQFEKQQKLAKEGIVNLDKYEKEIYNASHTERENAIRKANEEFEKIHDELLAVIQAKTITSSQRESEIQIENKKRAAADLLKITDANQDELEKIRIKYDEIDRKREVTKTNDYINQLKIRLAAEIAAHEGNIEKINEYADANESPLPKRAGWIGNERTAEKSAIRKQMDALDPNDKTDSVVKLRTDLSNQLLAIEKKERQDLLKVEDYYAQQAIDLYNKKYDNEENRIAKLKELKKLSEDDVLKLEIANNEKRKSNFKLVLGYDRDANDKSAVLKEKQEALRQLDVTNKYISMGGSDLTEEQIQKANQRKKDIENRIKELDIELAEKGKKVANYRLSIKERANLQKVVDEAPTTKAIKTQQIDDIQFKRNQDIQKDEISAELAHQKTLVEIKKKSVSELYAVQIESINKLAVLKKEEYDRDLKLNPNNKAKLDKDLAELKAFGDEQRKLKFDEEQRVREIEDNNIEYIENKRVKSEEAVRAAKQKTSDIIKGIYDQEEANYLKRANIFEKIATKQTEVDSYSIPDPSGKGTFIPKQNKADQIKAAEELRVLYGELGNEIISVVDMIGSSVSKVNKDIGSIITGFTSVIKAAAQGPIQAIVAAASFVFDKIIEAVNFDKAELAKAQDAYFNFNKMRLSSGEQTTAKLMELAEIEHKYNMDVIERNSYGNNQYRTEQLTEEGRFVNEKLKIQQDAANKSLDIQKDLLSAQIALTNSTLDKMALINIQYAEDIRKAFLETGGVTSPEFLVLQSTAILKKLKAVADLNNQIRDDDFSSEYDYQKSILDLQEDSYAKTIALIEKERNYRLQSLYDEKLKTGMIEEVYNRKQRTINNEQDEKRYQAQKTLNEQIQALNESNYGIELKLIEDTMGAELKEMESKYDAALKITKDYQQKKNDILSGRAEDRAEKQKQAGLLAGDINRIKPNLGAGFFRDNQLSFDTKDESARNQTQDAFNSGSISYEQQLAQTREQAVKRVIYLQYQLSLNQGSSAKVKLDLEQKITAAKKEYSDSVDKDMIALDKEKATAEKNMILWKGQIEEKRAAELAAIKSLDDAYKDGGTTFKTVMVSATNYWISHTKEQFNTLSNALFNSIQAGINKMQQNKIAYDKLGASGTTGGTGSTTSPTGTPKTVSYTDAEINAMKKKDALAQSGEFDLSVYNPNGSNAPSGGTESYAPGYGNTAPSGGTTSYAPGFSPLPPGGVPKPYQPTGTSLSFSGTGVTPTNIPNQNIIDRAPLMNFIQAAKGSTTAAGKMSDGELMNYMHQLGIKGYENGTSYLPRTGLYFGHQGEEITPAYKTRNNTNNNSTVINQGSINVYCQGLADDKLVGRIRSEVAAANKETMNRARVSI